jgi:aryl-alcohol dehydrogenase-like predicted oxidoreductase
MTFKLGNDLQINRLGFGTMRLTGKGIWGQPKDRSEAIKVLRRAVELGINFIDTADSYGPDITEELIAEALAPYKQEVVIATKAGLVRGGPDQWAPLARPEYLEQQVHLSLRRLKVEALDLWQLHRIDPTVAVEESLAPIVKLQKEGKIRHIGLSEVGVADIERVSKIVKVVSVQNEYNIGNRKHEEVLKYCEQNGIAFIPWFPIAAGQLAVKGGALDQAAKKHGASLSQLSLAWLLHHSPVILPIPGTSTLAHLEENTSSQDLKLTAQEWAEVEELAPVIKPYY